MQISPESDAIPVVQLPACATDTHVHVFGPQQFPFAAERRYTPPPAPVASLRQHLARHGAQRVVLVQPSVYGASNACLLDALGQLAPGTARGIAVVDVERTPREALVALHGAGVRGIRLNFEVGHEQDASSVQRQLVRAARLVDLPGWCVQIHCAAPLLGTVHDTLAEFRVPLVLDHFGGLRMRDLEQVHHQSKSVGRLLDTGRVYVKLSAFYRASDSAPGHEDLRALAQPWLAARPDRVLWGSDWPHTGGGAGSTLPRDPARVEPFRHTDLAASLSSLRAWCGGADVFRQVLVDNPSTLYGFEPAAT